MIELFDENVDTLNKFNDKLGQIMDASSENIIFSIIKKYQ